MVLLGASLSAALGGRAGRPGMLASSASRGHPRALLLALELGVMSSASGGIARGHDQVHVPCIAIVLFK